MNKQLWLTPVSPESPCGVDLEYDSEFLTLEAAAQGKPEQQYGNTIIPAEEPDWRTVEKLAEALLARTKDVRVLLHLTRACTANHGLSGLAVGLETIKTVLTEYWESVHPQLVIDGDEDPFLRSNALSGLAGRDGLLAVIRQAMLVKSAMGPLLVKEAEAILDNTASSDNTQPLNREQLQTLCTEAYAAEQPSLIALHKALEHARSIAALCDTQFGNAYAPDLSALINVLANLAKLIISTTQTASTSAQEKTHDAFTSASTHLINATQQAAQSLGITAIGSREDAIKVLEMVCRYIEKNEPTNPAPLLIKRAQKLMSLNFMDIMKELAPDGVRQVEMITGTTNT